MEGAAAQWSAHNAQRLGAALAYYTVLSLAPLLLIIVSIAGLVLGPQAVRGEIYWQIHNLVGNEGAGFVQALLKGAGENKSSGVLASVVGFIVLLLGASAVFAELRDDLNYIWDVPAPADSVWRGALKYRLISVGLVIACGLLITISVAATIALQAAEKYASGHLAFPAWILETANFGVTFLLTTLLFGLIYTVFPRRRVPWSDVAVGSIVTAALFTLGKLPVAFYVGRSGVGSLYGAAGSIVVLLVWVYYSAQIFLFGAEFTHVYSQRLGAIRHEHPTVQIDTADRPTSV